MLNNFAPKGIEYERLRAHFFGVSGVGGERGFSLSPSLVQDGLEPRAW